MYGDDEFRIDDLPFTPERASASSASASTTPDAAKLTDTGKKTADGQVILEGKFQPKQWFEGPGTRLSDGINNKGYPRSLISLGIGRQDQKLVKTSKNMVADAVSPAYYMKGVDTYGTFASMTEMAYVREIGSIGHCRVLTEGGGLLKAYPVRHTCT